MRRTFLNARSSRAAYRALGGQQARRTFATPSIKDNTPPSPVEPSKEQAHPIGAFYEAILRTPKPLPQEKPEVPPVTSQASPAQAPKPTPEPKSTPKVAAAEQKPAITPAVEPKEPSEPAASPAQQDKKPARRPRKPRHTAASKDEPKTKSVPSSSSSSLPPTPPSPGPAVLPQSSPPPPSPSTPPPVEEAEKQSEQEGSNDPQARARVVFGSSLSGPAERAERLARLRTESRLVAGVLVPPKPDEPDNCCMSGCVNCVWDRYRDEMEEWAGASAEADRRLQAREVGEGVAVTEDSMDGVEGGKRIELGVHEEVADRGVASMDADGGGLAVWNWEAGPSDAAGAKDAKDFWDEELYKNVPVGIREFMKQEKRLKEKHLREGTVGG
jgi:hypothetical protein